MKSVQPQNLARFFLESRIAVGSRGGMIRLQKTGIAATAASVPTESRLELDRSRGSLSQCGKSLQQRHEEGLIQRESWSIHHHHLMFWSEFGMILSKFPNFRLCRIS
ncbi:hypothetical protein AVEN_222888-1 [Araneus ventricosus]|uniref:Uncharacterized protein n=1 Tax=Araneus ventricosus TaxID=182803 RepID=A0A4Y2Q471_ARAVE|nr:hypothetical protein AVEN_222888-1 [Araneus ventricosus]